MMSDNLSWSSHHQYVCSKAYKALHLIKASIPISSKVDVKKALYVSLVRSRLTYCSQLWRPQYAKDVRLIERIQRRATKYVLNDFSLDYKSRLLRLKLLPLTYWWELQDLTFLVSCLKSPPDNIDIFKFISFSEGCTRSSTTRKLKVNFTRTSRSRHFYYNRVVKLWNVIPQIDLSHSFPYIKMYLKSIFWSHFVANYNTNNSCTLHFVCLCSNCYSL